MQSKESWSPRMRDWNLMAMLLAEIRDLLVQDINATIAAGGGKPRRVKPFPRPTTAIDRVKRKHAADTQAEIISLFAPHLKP